MLTMSLSGWRWLVEGIYVFTGPFDCEVQYVWPAFRVNQSEFAIADSGSHLISQEVLVHPCNHLASTYWGGRALYGCHNRRGSGAFYSGQLSATPPKWKIRIETTEVTWNFVHIIISYICLHICLECLHCSLHLGGRNIAAGGISKLELICWVSKVSSIGILITVNITMTGLQHTKQVSTYQHTNGFPVFEGGGKGAHSWKWSPIFKIR